MNPGNANRRFVMLAIVLGLIGAIFVYVAFSRSKSSGGGVSDVPVVVAKQDIPARTKITQSMVEVRLVPTDARSALSFSDVSAITSQSQATRFPIAANEQILSSKLVPLAPTASTASKSLSFAFPPGMRAIAVNTKPVLSAGGLVLPGDYVDVLVIYDIAFLTQPNDPTSRTTIDNYYVTTLLQNIEVLAVSTTVVDKVTQAGSGAEGPQVRNTEAKASPEAVTVTMSLTPEDAQKLFLAESNGKIRFAERAYGDTDERPLTPMLFQQDLLPRNIPNPFLQR